MRFADWSVDVVGPHGVANEEAEHCPVGSVVKIVLGEVQTAAVTEQSGQKRLGHVGETDKAAILVAHAAAFSLLFAIAVLDQDQAAVCCTSARFAGLLLLFSVQVLDVERDGFVEKADGIDGVLRVGVVETADGEFFGLFGADSEIEVHIGSHFLMFSIVL